MQIKLHQINDKPNECGPCTLCCKVMGIRELGKGTDIWCQHAVRSKGCAIYADRPQSCREFRCLWLEGGREELRPDRIHGVMMTTDDGRNVVIREDTGWPGYASQRLESVIQSVIRDGTRFVLIVCGKQRKFVARQDLADRLKFRADEDPMAEKHEIIVEDPA